MTSAYGSPMTTKKNEPTPVSEEAKAELLQKELMEGTATVTSGGDVKVEGTVKAAELAKQPEFVPAVGRIVHFEGMDGPVAALITGVNKDPKSTLSLTLFHPHGQVVKPSVEFSEKPQLGSWNVPPRV